MAKVYLAAATLSAAILAASATVHGRGPGGFGRFGGPGGPGGRGGPAGVITERLLFPCRAACLEAGRSCADDADDAAAACAEAACAPEIEAARTACADESSSDGCRDARGTLRECMQSCLSDRRTAADACRATADDCLDACDTATAE